MYKTYHHNSSSMYYRSSSCFAISPWHAEYINKAIYIQYIYKLTIYNTQLKVGGMNIGLHNTGIINDGWKIIYEIKIQQFE